jgi:hypothetical protein
LEDAFVEAHRENQGPTGMVVSGYGMHGLVATDIVSTGVIFRTVTDEMVQNRRHVVGFQQSFVAAAPSATTLAATPTRVSAARPTVATSNMPTPITNLFHQKQQRSSK